MKWMSRARLLKFWEWLFLAFVFLLPWQTRLILRPGLLNGSNWEYGIIGLYATEILLWSAFFLWLIHVIASEAKQSHSWTGLLRFARNIVLRRDCFVALLLALFLINIFFATDKMLAMQSWRYIFEAVVVFFLICQHSRPRWLIAAFLSGLTIQAILGIAQFLLQTTWASQYLGLTLHLPVASGASVLENSAGRWLRAYGGLPHPNVLGGYLVVGLAMIVALFNRYTAQWRARFFLLIAYGLQLTALFFTFSRAAWLAFILAVSLNCYVVFRKKVFNIQSLIFTAIFLLTIFSYLFFPLIIGRFSGQARLEVKSTAERFFGYSEAWQLFKKRPLTGVGLGSYTLAAYQELDSTRPAWDYQPTHNVFALALVELGMIGAILIFFILFHCHVSILPKAIFLVFIPLALLDHYLWSLYSGWMLLAVGLGLAAFLDKKAKA